MLHAHIIGTALQFRHIRNGEELSPIDTNWNYDFNYQQTITYDEEIEIKPGDEFIMECYVNSSSRNWITFGAESTRDEMCVEILYVYPKPKLAACTTQHTYDGLYNWMEYAQNDGYLIGDIDDAFNYWDWESLSWNIF